jgi:hypothetical protein
VTCASSWNYILGNLSVSSEEHTIHNFHSRTVHLDIVKVFTPTDAQVFLKRDIKIHIKTAPKCFGVITILRERTILSKRK